MQQAHLTSLRYQEINAETLGALPRAVARDQSHADPADADTILTAAYRVDGGEAEARGIAWGISPELVAILPGGSSRDNVRVDQVGLCPDAASERSLNAHEGAWDRRARRPLNDARYGPNAECGRTPAYVCGEATRE